MKKTLILVIIFLLSMVLIGCNLIMTTTTSTTDPRSIVINNEFVYLDEIIPESLSADYEFPGLNNDDITYTLTLDDVMLSENTIHYSKLAFDSYLTLKITLSYQGYSDSKEYTIVQLRDEDMFKDYEHNQVYVLIDEEIKNQLPEQVISDFTMPSISYENVSITYSVNMSRIYNNRFIYFAPSSDQKVTITARINNNNDIRTYQYFLTVKALKSLPEIPRIYINTENNQDVYSKDYYMNATFTLTNFDDNNHESILLYNQPIQIRTRGNSSLDMPKKSYKIEFDEKQKLLFDYKEKEWVLIANFADQTLIRNYLAYNLADDMGMEFSPSTRFVDVYVNGNYQGNYLLTDQVEVTSDRVNIDEHSSEVDTGYLIEWDLRALEDGSILGKDYFLLYGISFVIKSPNPDKEYFNQNQFNYIEDYFHNVFTALKNHQDYSSLIDEDSFIDWFIVEELFKNVDSGFASIFYYKDTGGKLKMGPVWDFDLSSYNPGHLDYYNRQPQGWYTSLEYKNIWFYYLMQYSSFRKSLQTRWNEVYTTSIQSMIDSIYTVSDSITKSRVNNFEKWDVIGTNREWYTSDEVYNAKTYEEQVFLLYSFLNTRGEWMNTEINKF